MTIKSQTSKIWLKCVLYITKSVFVLSIISTPFITHASVFSFFCGLINKEADAGTNNLTSQNLDILQADISPAKIQDTSYIAMIDNSALMQESGVNGTQADLTDEKSTQISLYVVRQGDSLSQIAKMFDVSVNTIIWANNIKGSIHEGEELIILPISGVNHKVVKGDTIRSIASKYSADMNDIKNFNDLKSDSDLVVGSNIIVPDGEAAPVLDIAAQPTEKLHGAGGPLYKDYYIRPIDGGVKTQGLHGYNAVDLGGVPIGTPIHAAADGIVIVARSGGWNGGYGSYVVISHPNGTQTLYGHMSKVIAVQGQAVSQGETIGLLGSTGKSTGPHVHFEIRGAANPF